MECIICLKCTVCNGYGYMIHTIKCEPVKMQVENKNVRHYSGEYQGTCPSCHHGYEIIIDVWSEPEGKINKYDIQLYGDICQIGNINFTGGIVS